MTSAGRIGAALKGPGICLALALAIASCGSEAPDPEQQVAEAFADLGAAFDSGEMRKVCAGLSQGARLAASKLDASGSCPAGLRELADPRSRATSAERSGRRRIVRVGVDGDRARVTTTLHTKIPGLLRFSEADGEWKLSQLFIEPLPKRSTRKSIENGGFNYDTWLERGGRRVPCPPVDYVIGKSAKGACALRVTGPDTGLVMLTAFGDFALARCRAAYDLHIHDGNSLLADRVEFTGPAPCNEIRHCKDGETGLRYPWQGRVQAGPGGRGFIGDLDACVNTPVGRVRGFIYSHMRRRNGDWTAASEDYPVGDSSLQLTGRWDIAPDSFGMRDPPG